ncbi:ubinuclein-2-like isoform X2 [Cololabis saira]|uniref:ubinuclein-2-like isoform X2 n=1 Tax=Cololabis saira TaxID=129043 RepID=UPI002AD3A39B|nr:ubinuclein-2-like isoform X2 [Cololabis saira]
MAEPRKVQFVTLSAFNAGAAADPKRRRLEDEGSAGGSAASAGDRDGGSAASAASACSAGDRALRRATVRLRLSLPEPDDRCSAEFNYSELVQNLQVKNNAPANNLTDPNDPFNDEERERLQVEGLAKKFEAKYYDELVPASLNTKLGGFYINTGTLQFRTASDSEGDEDKLNNDTELVMKKRKKKEVNNLEEKNLNNNKALKQGVTALNRPEKKKRKKLMKDSLYLASMLRRFAREKEELRKRTPNMAAVGLAGGAASKPHGGDSASLPLAPAAAQPQDNATANDLSLADLTSDPAVMSLLGSANEKQLQDLLGDLDFGLVDNDQQHVMVAARENGILGVGVPAHKAAAGGPGPSGGLFSPPPLPDRLPAPLMKRIEDLRAASRQFDQEGRKKFFTLDMNNILLDIELQVQEQPPDVRSAVYCHMEAFVPCNKEALLKRLKKLSINIQDDRLRAPLLKLKLAVCSVMPEQITRYDMAKAAKQQSEEGDKNGSEEEDEEKPGKRVMGPRKKFVWDDKLRNLLCCLVRVKLSCYEMEKQVSLSVEDYLKAFLDNEVKPLWPKGWMQTRILFKESLVVHNHLTGNLVKRRVLPGPKAKAKDGLWIHKPLLTLTSAPPLLGAGPAQRPLTSSSEPICLSDSLDEDLTAPTLDSISHALTLLGHGSKGLGLADSPLSPPPLQMPTSSPPPVAPHYPSASPLSSPPPPAVVTTTSAGSPSPTTTMLLSSPPATSASSSRGVSSLARVQPAGLMLASYGPAKAGGAAGQAQNQRQVAMATPNHRPGALMGKLHSLHSQHSQPSPPPAKQRPPPTASPLLPPHQRGILGVMGGGGAVLTKSGAKSASSSNGGGAAPFSSSQSRANSTSLHGLQAFCPASPAGSAPNAHVAQPKAPPTQPKAPPPQAKAQPNFITPMQATLTKSHSSNSSPIIKLTPRPPAPTPPPSPSPSSSPSHQLINPGTQQFSAKTPKAFRPPFSAAAGPAKTTQSGCSFAGAHKPQSGVIITASNSKALAAACSLANNLPPPSSSSASANHAARQRAVGGANQGSKAGNGWVASGALSTTSTTPHLSQVTTTSPLLSNHSALPLGFGMLGGLVPVSLPFQFPSLLNFSTPGAPGTSGSSNSGYPLAQSDLMDLYKSLQSGSQAALPPHLQLAFSDANQSQGGDVKRKSH